MVRVQVVADPSGLEDKALTVTARPKVVGRYLVAEWGKPRLNYSKDIGPRPKKRLQEALASWGEKLALLVRSRAADTDIKHIISEAKWLSGIFDELPGEPAVLFAPTPVEQALLALGDETETILVESGDLLNEIRSLTSSRWADLADLVHLHKGEPLFEAYGVEEAIEEALANRIELPSGGWISIYETPALTAIDVNMGGALAGRSAGEAQKLVNLEAALAIFFHMRFQDMGGLIVVDFIDMKAKGAIADLTRLVDDLIADDPVPVRRTGVSPNGLMEFARKRSGISLRQRFLSRPVTYMAPEASALALLAKAERLGKTGEAGNLLIKSTPDVMTWLQDNDHLLDQLEKRTRRTLALEAGRITEVALRKD